MLKTLDPLLSYGQGVVLEAIKQGQKDEDAIFAIDAVRRWWKQIDTPYFKLSEKEKESDREWARKVMNIVVPIN
jgi:hypothetical protein